MGKPNDPEFQHSVLLEAFDLLKSPSQVIKDFTEIIVDNTEENLVCSLPPRFDASVHPAVDEARGLRQAYDRAVKQFGNRAGAARTLKAEAIPDAINAFVKVAEGTPWNEAGIPGIPARVAQDIRGYYEMAAIEIAGHRPAAWAVYRWYRYQTAAGTVIKEAQAEMKRSGVKEGLWRFMLPLDTQIED